MQTFYEEIRALAERYSRLMHRDDALFDALNALPHDVVREVARECERHGDAFDPVGFLRGIVARTLLDQRMVDFSLLEYHKSKIERGDSTPYPHLDPVQRRALERYRLRREDSLARWGSAWRILYVFFYRGELRRRVEEGVCALADYLLSQVGLSDYTARHACHGFASSSDACDDCCRITLYPKACRTPARAYALRLTVGAAPHVSLHEGEELGFHRHFEAYDAPSLDEAVARLRSLAEPVRSLNGALAHRRPAFYPTAESPSALVAEDEAVYGNTPNEALPRTRADDDGETASPFLAEAELERLQELLRRRKNVILQGPPGVGKSFLARWLTGKVAGADAERAGRVGEVLFHPSYTYEEFIEGYRPDGQGGFTLREGFFTRFCRRAAADPAGTYLLRIEEINRGHTGRIFGEAMQLIEADKRGSALALAYSGRLLAVPPNLLLIGTMNTADRSLAVVDYALRRRFAFATLHPEFGAPLRTLLLSRGMEAEWADRVLGRLVALNRAIAGDGRLGPGFCVGHSVLCTYRPGEGPEAWWADVVAYRLEPLIEELWYEDPECVRTRIAALEK